MNILVLNAGSSSLKFQLIETDEHRIAADTDERLARGTIERIGSQALVRFSAAQSEYSTAMPIRDHRTAIDTVLRWVNSGDSGLPGVRAIDPGLNDAAGVTEGRSSTAQKRASVPRSTGPTIAIPANPAPTSQTHPSTDCSQHAPNRPVALG